MLEMVERVNVKHSWPGSSTLSDVMAIGTHWIKASSLRVKLSLRDVKSSTSVGLSIIVYISMTAIMNSI